MKTSYIFVFRRRLWDVFKNSWSRRIYSPWWCVFKTSLRRFQDVLQKRIQDIFKMSWRRFEDVLRTSWRHLQDVLARGLEDDFKTSSRCLGKMSSRHLQDVFKMHHQVKLLLLTRLQDIFETYPGVVLLKMLKKHLWNSFLLYLLVEILHLVHEISSFQEVLHKIGVLENFSKFTDKHKKQSSAGILSKDVLKDFAKLTKKHFCLSLFFNKVTGWKPETVRSSHWRYSVKKIFLKIS